MGRPPVVLTDEQRIEVGALAAVLSKEHIADYLGVSRPTFDALLERDEELSLRYQRGRVEAIHSVANALLTKARDGDVTSMIFFLKTQAGWKEKSELEVSGTVTVKAYVGLDPEEV